MQAIRAEATPAAYDAALGYARLGGRALLAGFLATLVNACVASMLL